MLYNSRTLVTFDAVASDGPVGTVHDILIDDETWKVRHVIVDTGGLIAPHQVLIPPGKIKELRHPADEMIISASKAEISASADAMSAPPVSVHHNDPAIVQAPIDPNLRSARTIGGYAVEATDERLGHVHGIIIDDQTWDVRYVVVDTGELFTADQVLVVPSAVQAIDWEQGLVTIGLTSEAVHKCPEYDADLELTRQYEGFLHDYYGWTPYWH